MAIFSTKSTLITLATLTAGSIVGLMLSPKKKVKKAQEKNEPVEVEITNNPDALGI